MRWFRWFRLGGVMPGGRPFMGGWLPGGRSPFGRRRRKPFDFGFKTNYLIRLSYLLLFAVVIALNYALGLYHLWRYGTWAD